MDRHLWMLSCFCNWKTYPHSQIELLSWYCDWKEWDDKQWSVYKVVGKSGTKLNINHVEPTLSAPVLLPPPVGTMTQYKQPYVRLSQVITRVSDYTFQTCHTWTRIIQIPSQSMGLFIIQMYGVRYWAGVKHCTMAKCTRVLGGHKNEHFKNIWQNLVSSISLQQAKMA